MLSTLIKKGESENLEFKPSLSQINEIIRTISAFANKNGGKIIIGISASGEVMGLQIGKDTIERMTGKIAANLEPKIYPKISIEEIEKRKVVVIEVDESEEKPVFAFGRAFKRVGKSTLRMGRDELERLILEKRRVYWDEQFCEEASLKGIDEEKVRWFLEKAEFERKVKINRNISLEESLERLGLIRDGKLTNAALLLFGKTPQKFFLQAEVRCARFKGTKPVKPLIDMKIFEGSIIDQVDKALNFVLEHTPMRVYLIGKPQREEKYEYPPDALREAIINAICHRDYKSPGSIQIRIFDNRAEVWNPGTLPEPLTLEDLKRKHKSIPRNPLIAKCFFLIKFIEQWGTGTNDMINMCLERELPEPIFEHITGDFVVTFRKTRYTEEYLEKIKLNERQLKAIEYLKENKKIIRKEYASLFNCSIRTSFNDIQDMVNKKILMRKGKGRYTYYKLI